MKENLISLKTALLCSLTITIALCPIAVASTFPTPALARGISLQPPIQFTPDVEQLRLTAVALTAQPAAIVGTPPPFGPSHSYTEANRPEYSYIEGGDEGFGYGPTEQDPHVYLMWVTDESGTHYYSVAADSDQLRGVRDPVTGERQANGFDHLISDYETRAQEVLDQELLVNEHQNSRMAWHGAALGTALVGGVVCAIFTVGTCFVAFGVAAAGAWGYGAVQNGDKVSAQDALEVVQGQLDRSEANLQGKFEQSISAGP